MTILVTGGTGFTGYLFLNYLSQVHPQISIQYLVQPTTKIEPLTKFTFDASYIQGNSASKVTWDQVFTDHTVDTIVHIASIRHVPILLESVSQVTQSPRLIIVGTTGVYSQYNQYSGAYKSIEQQLEEYTGSYSLLRPTMIYGSHRDKNLHKLIQFCDRYQFFPVFGSGQSLLQPVHADDLAQAILSVLLNPKIEGAYDLSGGTVVTFLELLALVEKLLGKPVRPLCVPYNLGLWSATLAEILLGKRSPIRREQILRLQEDKAYPHDSAQLDLNFFPRTLEEGLGQEVELMRSLGMISS